MNAFGCIEYLARISRVHEKPVTTARGKPLPKGEIGLAVNHTRVRKSLSQAFQDYLKALDEWLTFMETTLGTHWHTEFLSTFLPTPCDRRMRRRTGSSSRK